MTGRLGRRLSVALVAALLLSLIAPGYAGKINGPIEVSSFTDSAGSININVGKGEGISVGTKGVIIRDGKQIAEYKVVQVHWGFSRVELSNVAEGVTVKAGDSAPISGSEQGSTTVKKKSKSKLIWTVLGIAAIAVLLGGRGGGGDSGGNGAITLTTQKTTNADGSGTITITARIDAQNGDPAPDGTPATFSSTAGTLNRTLVSTSAGRAVVILTYDDSVGAEEAIVTVKALGSTATTTVSFTSSIDLTASAESIQIVGSGGAVTESTITAVCQGATGDPATTGDVDFTTSMGTLSISKAPIGAGGIATTKFTSSAAGNATVTASWSKSKATVLIKITAGPPYSLEVSSSTSSIQCDGNSSATITATVKDVGGNLAANGTVVDFTVIPDAGGGGNGSISSPASTINGVATTNLYSRDSTGLPSKSGTARIKAEVRRANQPSDVPLPATDLINQNTTIQFIASDVAQIVLSANPTNIANNTDKTTTITAVVKNSANLPIPGSMQVRFTANHGVFSDSGISTTSDGIATITLRPDSSGAPSWNGLVDVTATAGDFTTTSNGLVIFSGPASSAYSDATISPTSIPKLNGESTITVIARDLNDHPVADGITVTVTTDKTRTTLTPTSATTSGGTATFTLKTSTDDTNPTPLGGGSVTVRVGAWTKTLSFTIVD